ncbi:MAG: uL15 family ribosomal protein [Nanoarchaeota archaeon]|nr:uL15 family ribosomal protein [Nanoarchaeota archaeon]
MRQKKLRKYRGSKTHGGGSKKKRRGAGNRGGRGMAGSGKRADQKKPTILKLYGNSYFGKKGFHSKTRKKIKAINISDLEEKIELWVKQGIAELKQDEYCIDLGKIKIQKLLARGKPARKYNLQVKHASENARKKIEEKGGKVNVSF